MMGSQQMDKNSGIKAPSDLRQRAERALEALSTAGKAASRLSPEEMGSLLHEFQVHQVELEMQNEELRRIQGELELARDRYSHLYDFAPAGYLTIDAAGMISATNLTAGTMLQRERIEMLSLPFSRLVAGEDQDIFYLLRQQLLAGEADTPRSCRLRLVKKNGDLFYAWLECMKVNERPGKGFQILVSVIDVSAQQQAETALRRAHETLEQRVETRTADLQRANDRLALEIEARKQSETLVHRFLKQLLRTQEHERKLIAFELHDNIAQNFALLKLTCNQLLKGARLASDLYATLWAEMSGCIDAAIDEVRHMATGLRPDMLDQMGLVKALESFCDTVARESDLHIDFEPNGMETVNLDPDMQIQIYRLVQEGLNHICRHADAGNARVELALSGSDVILRIEEDGRGIDEKRLQPGSHKNDRHMDLQSLKERVQLLRGRMQIQSQPKKGTRIQIRFPIAPLTQ
jgi:PAS domain S-box-containing protein